MRFQFQIKHLMWLVFGSAVLCGVARTAPTVVIAVYLPAPLFVGLSGLCAVFVVRSLQDWWTSVVADRSDMSPVAIAAVKTACILAGVLTYFGMVACFTLILK